MSIQEKHLSDSWQGFKKFILLKEKPPNGYMWSGWILTRISTTTRTDHVCPEVSTKIGKHAQNRRKGTDEIETEARQCRKTERNFIFSTQKNATIKLERLLTPAMPAKKYPFIVNKQGQHRRLAMKRSSEQCMIVLWNLMNLRHNEQNFYSLKTIKNHNASKGVTAVTHYKLVHKFIPMPQAIKIQDG